MLADMTSGAVFGPQNQRLKVAYIDSGEAAKLVLDYLLGNHLEGEDINKAVTNEIRLHYETLDNFAEDTLKRFADKARVLNIRRRLLALPEVPGDQTRQKADEFVKQNQ